MQFICSEYCRKVGPCIRSWDQYCTWSESSLGRGEMYVSLDIKRGRSLKLAFQADISGRYFRQIGCHCNCFVSSLKCLFLVLSGLRFLFGIWCSGVTWVYVNWKIGGIKPFRNLWGLWVFWSVCCKVLTIIRHHHSFFGARLHKLIQALLSKGRWIYLSWMK